MRLASIFLFAALAYGQTWPAGIRFPKGTSLPSSQPAAGITVTSKSCGGNTDGCTTAAVDTTGVTGIICVDSVYTGGPGFGFTDSKGNSWTKLTTYTATAAHDQMSLYYCGSPTVGTGHTFGDTGTGSYAGVGCLLLKGSNSTLYVPSSDRGQTDALFSGTGPIQPGAFSVPGLDIDIAVMNVSFGFPTTGSAPGYTVAETQNSVTSEGFVLAYQIPGTTTSLNPAWTPSATGYYALASATFAHQ